MRTLDFATVLAPKTAENQLSTPMQSLRKWRYQAATLIDRVRAISQMVGTGLSLHLVHQSQQVFFGVAEECHPQIVVGHACDHVRLVFEAYPLLFQPRVCCFDVRYREVEDRCCVIELGL